MELALSMGGSHMDQNRNVHSSGSHMSPAMDCGSYDVATMEENGTGTFGVIDRFDPENWDGSDDNEAASASGHVTATAGWITFW